MNTEGVRYYTCGGWCIWVNPLPVIRPLASIGGCQLIKMARGRPSRLITVKSLGAELGAASYGWMGEEERRGENKAESAVISLFHF